MKLIDAIKKRVDNIQQSHRGLAFPVAVIKRYGDDETGKQAALITYYGFLSLFPLLLVFITVLNIIIAGNDTLRAQVSQTVFQYFPALGDQLQKSVHSATGSGIALALEILILLYGARGLALMLRQAFDHVWHVADKKNTDFVKDTLRSLAMMAAVGGGIIIGTVISYGLSSILHIGPVGTVFITLVNAAFTCGLFLAVFRLGTSKRIATHSLVRGAVITGVGLLIVQHFGGYIMANQLHKLNSTAGSFALALAMLFWIYLQAQIIMYALTITAVRVQRDYPKQLFE